MKWNTEQVWSSTISLCQFALCKTGNSTDTLYSSSTDISADIRSKPIYRIGYLPPIKYWRSTVTLNCLFLRVSLTAFDY